MDDEKKGITFTLVQCPHLRAEAIAARAPAIDFMLICVDCFWTVRTAIKSPGSINKVAEQIEMLTHGDENADGWAAAQWDLDEMELRAATADSKLVSKEADRRGRMTKDNKIM